MNKTEKQETVSGLEAQFKSIQSAFLIDYRGLKVVDATELRRKIRGIDGTYIVVKNTLALRAAKGTRMEQVSEHFQGPTAVAYHPRDAVALAKVLTEAAKSYPSVVFKAALVEGKALPAEGIQALALMPPREVLLGRFAGTLMAPLQKFASVLRAPLRDLALVLKQIPKE